VAFPLHSISLRKSVPGEEARWQRPRNSLRHEGVEEGFHRSKEEDGRTHHDGAPGSRSRPTISVPSDSLLRLPDRRQAPPHSRLVPNFFFVSSSTVFRLLLPLNKAIVPIVLFFYRYVRFPQCKVPKHRYLSSFIFILMIYNFEPNQKKMANFFMSAN
ncbi:Ribosomal protein S6 kinase alpha-5, partial [Daphnia magna]